MLPHLIRIYFSTIIRCKYWKMTGITPRTCQPLSRDIPYRTQQDHRYFITGSPAACDIILDSCKIRKKCQKNAFRFSLSLSVSGNLLTDHDHCGIFPPPWRMCAYIFTGIFSSTFEITIVSNENSPIFTHCSFIRAIVFCTSSANTLRRGSLRARRHPGVCPAAGNHVRPVRPPEPRDPSVRAWRAGQLRSIPHNQRKRGSSGSLPMQLWKMIHG